MQRDISPHALAHASFCKPHDLRIWRGDGLLEGVGERIGKGYMFSIEEAVRIAVSVRLARCNILYRDAFEIVEKCQPQTSALCEHSSLLSGAQDYVLRVTMQPAFNYVIVRSDDAPLARINFENDELAQAEVNLSAVVRSVKQRVAEFQVQHVV